MTLFKIDAGTIGQIYAPFNRVSHKNDAIGIFDTAPWKSFTSPEGGFFEGYEVWDRVGVLNRRNDIPVWAIENIERCGSTILAKENAAGIMCYFMIPFGTGVWV